MKRCAIWLTVLVVIVALTSAAVAAVPRLINYQGALSDARGVAVDGIHTVTFSFYSSTDAGAPALWREVHRSIDVKDGLFHVVLGSVNPIPDKTFASGQLWIGISVDNDPEIEPRMQMTAVPWAVRAAVADALAGDSGSGPAPESSGGAQTHVRAGIRDAPRGLPGHLRPLLRAGLADGERGPRDALDRGPR